MSPGWSHSSPSPALTLSLRTFALKAMGIWLSEHQPPGLLTQHPAGKLHFSSPQPQSLVSFCSRVSRAAFKGATLLTGANSAIGKALRLWCKGLNSESAGAGSLSVYWVQDISSPLVYSCFSSIYFIFFKIISHGGHTSCIPPWLHSSPPHRLKYIN